MPEPLRITVFRRLRDEGLWTAAEPFRDSLIRQFREEGFSREEAREKAYERLDAMFPSSKERPNAKAEGIDDRQTEKHDHLKEGVNDETIDGANGEGVVPVRDTNDGETSRPGTPAHEGESVVSGLGDVPPTWPDLPANAPLRDEVQWVLANRIRCVREQRGSTVVDLSKALTPAPSYASLGWLETSIRAFAKFVDVSAKITSASQDDADKAKRERLAIDEIRALLTEMLDNPTN